MNFFAFDHQLNAVRIDDDWQRQRSFLYGDGHFTTAKVIEGHIQLFPLHLKRLEETNQKLCFNPIDFERLALTCETLAKELTFGVLKVQVSRGLATRGYGTLADTTPTIFISVSELPESFKKAEPIELKVANTQLGWNPSLAGMKHCNRLEQVMVANELESRGLADGLVCDIKGNLVETNKANVFWSCEGRWFTPVIKNAGINGVMRQYIMSQIAVVELSRNVSQVTEEADAMFISNSLIGIQAITQASGRGFNTDIVERLKQELEV